jgi:hypothetical protein
MADICGTLGANTGKPVCDVPLAAIKNFLPTLGAEFTAAELVDSDTIKAAILERMLEVRGTTDKLYLFPLANESEPTTGDRVTATLADGFEKTLLDPVPKYVMRAGTVGLYQHQPLTAFNGYVGKGYFIDRNNRFFYLIKTDGTGKGFSVADVYTNAPGFGSTAALNPAVTNITMGSIDEFKYGPIGIIQLDFDIASLSNIEDVQIVEKAASASSVYTVGGKTKYGQTDIYTAYSTALANSARWVVTNLQTNATIPVTTVTADATNKGWDVTVDATAWGLLSSGDKFSINIADPATLEAAGVTGIEGIRIVYTK